MATRLYPITKAPSLLEKLARVPEGTHHRLIRLKAKYQPARNDDEEKSYREELDNDPELDRLDLFQLFGWGRLNNATCEYLQAVLGQDVEGGQNTFDENVIQGVLNAMEITLPEGIVPDDLGGLCWG